MTRPRRGRCMSILHRRGWDVLIATTIAEAFNLLKQNPHWVVLDLMLPDGDGTTILSEIRRQRLEIKVVVTTGSSDDVRLQSVLDLHPDVFLTKPVNLNELLSGLI